MQRFFDHITQITGSVVQVIAEGVRYGEVAALHTKMGISLAQVIRLDGNRVSLQVFTGTSGVSTVDRIEFLGHPLQVPSGAHLLGRIFNGAGEPRDSRPPVIFDRIEARGHVVNPVSRKMPERMVQTGIPMIDVFNTLVESQKLPIFAPAGEPYNQLLARIGLQADADVIILGGIGLRHDDYLFFRSRFEEAGVFSRSILFVHTAAEPTVEAVLVPDMCLSVGEHFAVRGKRVLVLLSDMTAFCDALKEVAITMEQIPSNRGYPGDLYSQLAARYEKAVDLAGGSLTILAVTTMPGDDVTHPIPDNTGYITEGQLYLRNGRIEPFGSLSRLKQRVNGDTRKDHRSLMTACIQLYAACRESLEKRSMGFEMSDWDRKLIAYGQRFEDELMDLSVDIPLTKALDTCWKILADCFEPMETGLSADLIDEFWPEPTHGEP